MTSKSNEAHAANPSQTIPLITEELAAATSTTQHATTPVMPPNPIRRDNGATPEALPGTLPGVLPEPGRLSESVSESSPETQSGNTDDAAEKKEKSAGRVSATQLLAGAAAAATSSVIGGQLGVAGTVVGAGVASVITGLAVTLYTSSLDKGTEKIKEVGSKLAPAVKAKSIGAKTQRSAAVAAGQPTGTFGTPSDETDDAEAAGGTAEGAQKTWWQNLRRKRVLYPVIIGVATFGIGLGAVVMAESFTDADISPGTSQISRTVAGHSGTGDESGTSHEGSANVDSGSSGTGSQPGQNPNQGSGNDTSMTNEGESTSAREGSSGTSSSTDQTGTDPGTDDSSSTVPGDDDAGTVSDSNGASSTGADASGGGSGSAEGSSGSGSQGEAGGSSSTDGSGAGGGAGDGGGSDSGAGSAGGGSAGTAQG